MIASSGQLAEGRDSMDESVVKLDSLICFNFFQSHLLKTYKFSPFTSQSSTSYSCYIFTIAWATSIQPFWNASLLALSAKKSLL